ncbi:MAG TPA: hypothetical protein PLY93_13870 [Turneriella sp.]|nr:hypothetical protein [Turneriella sp.]
MRRLIVIALIAPLIWGCTGLVDDEKKGEICIHYRQQLTYPNSSCTEGAETDTKQAYFCEDDVKEINCLTLPTTSCPASAPYITYTDNAKYYGKRKCADDGYITSCPSDAKYKVADNTAFCPN